MKKSTISAIAAVSAAGVIALGLGAVTDWYRNWNAKSWFNYWGKGAPVQQPVDPDTPDTPDEPSKPVDRPENPVAVSSIRMASSVTYSAGNSSMTTSIKAIVLPADAWDKSVNFTAAWNNPSSTWANGKTVDEYVTVTANGATATVTCEQAFGEQIIITCTSVDNPEAVSTCTVDYEKRVTNATAKIVDSSTGDVYMTLNSDGTITGGVPFTTQLPFATCNIVYEPTYSIYSKDKDMTGEIGMTITDPSVGYWGSSKCNMSYAECRSETCNHKCRGTNTIKLTDTATFDYSLLRSMIRPVNESVQFSDTEIRYGITDRVTFHVSLWFGGVNLKTYENVPYNNELLKVAVQNVTLDNNAIVF